MKRALLVLLLITLFAAACGSDDSDSAVAVDDRASSEARVGTDAIATESEDAVAAGPADDAGDSSTESGSDDGAAASSGEGVAESDGEPADESEAAESTAALSEPVAGSTDADSSSADTLDAGSTDADSSSADTVDAGSTDDTDEAAGRAHEEFAADLSGASDAEEAGSEAVGVEVTAPPAVEATPAPEPAPSIRPQAGTLTAADVDDNLNFDFFNEYLGRVQQQFGPTLPSARLSDRVVIDVVGPNGIGVGNAEIRISDQNRTSVFTNSAGRAHLYPTYIGVGGTDALSLTITDATGSVVSERSQRLQDLDDDRTITIDVAQGHTLPPAALDIALVLDTTGSMSDELRYLTVEFESIVSNLRADYGNVDMRFALIAYRDTGDQYVTRTFDFTGDVQQMVAQIADQRADGGGDYPEAMDAALREANALSWRTGDVARVLILNADAPPHEQAAAATLDSARSLAQQGVRLYPLAASGVGDTAEYLMRLMAATSGGRHLFLTDDSGVGLSHQEPKTECYVVTHLNDLIRRVLASELAGERIEAHSSSIIRSVGQYDRGRCV